MSLVLIVDDEYACREWAAQVVRDMGHEALTVGDAAGALLLVSGHEPDLILLDLMMPGLDGVGFLLTLRTRLRVEAPVIVITRGASPEVESLVNDLGVAAILCKLTLTPPELEAHIHDALASRGSPTV